MKIKHIIFDFNGTIINDVDLCLELLNNFLKEQNKELVDINRYKNIFTFPIEEYYRLAGIDFNIESFSSLSKRFIEVYQPRSYTCGLYNNTYETLKYLKDKGYKLYILSASERNNLLLQCKNYNIEEYFVDILGIDDIHAKGKTDIALKFIRENNINSDEILFVGDTLHDYEVSKAINCLCYLVSQGHQSVEVLDKSGCKIIDSISDLKELF